MKPTPFPALLLLSSLLLLLLASPATALRGLRPRGLQDDVSESSESLSLSESSESLSESSESLSESLSESSDEDDAAGAAAGDPSDAAPADPVDPATDPSNPPPQPTSGVPDDNEGDNVMATGKKANATPGGRKKGPMGGRVVDLAALNENNPDRLPQACNRLQRQIANVSKLTRRQARLARKAEKPNLNERQRTRFQNKLTRHNEMMQTLQSEQLQNDITTYCAAVDTGV